jgi:hypothetical protein
MVRAISTIDAAPNPANQKIAHENPGYQHTEKSIIAVQRCRDLIQPRLSDKPGDRAFFTIGEDFLYCISNDSESATEWTTANPVSAVACDAPREPSPACTTRRWSRPA